MTDLFRYTPEVGDTGWRLPPHVVALLAERDRQLEDYLEEVKDAVESVTVTVGEGSRRTLGLWVQDNVAASQTNVALNLYGDTTRTARLAVRGGSVTGIVVRSNAARSAGTLTVEVTVAGAGTGLTAVLDGSNTTAKATTQDVGTDTFTAGQEIGVRVTTDGSWAPTTADISVDVEVVE